jgi:hypothetical protein
VWKRVGLHLDAFENPSPVFQGLTPPRTQKKTKTASDP